MLMPSRQFRGAETTAHRALVTRLWLLRQSAMLQALLLDMDGTLVDSEPLHFIAHRRFLAEVGIVVTEAQLLGNIGKGDQDFYQYLADKAGISCDPQRWVQRKTAILQDIYRTEGVPAKPGALALVQAAQTANLPRALVTSSERESARLALESIGLAKHLSLRVCAEDVAKHKPDPEPYYLACAQLGVLAEHVVVIEDSPSGVRAGIAAGCYVIGVAGLISAADLCAAGAHRVVTSLTELTLATLRQAAAS